MSVYYASKLSAVALSALLLSACASTSTQEVSVIPAKTADITRQDGVFTQPLSVDTKKPGCTGQCPVLKVASLVFPGNQALTHYVDQQLAQMAQNAAFNTGENYTSVDDFTRAYWQQAGRRDEALLYAKPRYRNKAITAIELGFFHYATGAAHGAGEVKLINWDNRQEKNIPFEAIVLPNQIAAFNQQLAQAHQQWLAVNKDAQEVSQQYQRLWPFQPSQNIALTDTGVIVKYNSYEIAPYASGQPELLIPYPRLQGILRPAFLPN